MVIKRKKQIIEIQKEINRHNEGAGADARRSRAWRTRAARDARAARTCAYARVARALPHATTPRVRGFQEYC